MTSSTPVYLVRKVRALPSGKRAAYWQLKWFSTTGREHTESLGRAPSTDHDADAVEDVADAISRREAERLRREKEASITTGSAPRDKPGAMTLRRFLELDREAIRPHARPATIKVHRLVSDHAAAALGADLDVAKVRPEHADRIANWLAQEHEIGGKRRKACSRATIRRSIATLKAAWNRGLKRNRVASNPFAQIRMGKVQSKQKRIFSQAEIDTMIEATSDQWWKAIIRLGFTTGLRIGELLNLTWDDIDEGAGAITVSAKRRSADRLEWSAKSHEERTVPLQPNVAAKLLPRLRVQGGGSPYLFISRERLRLLLALQESGCLSRRSG